MTMVLPVYAFINEFDITEITNTKYSAFWRSSNATDSKGYISIARIYCWIDMKLK